MALASSHSSILKCDISDHKSFDVSLNEGNFYERAPGHNGQSYDGQPRAREEKKAEG